MTTVKLTDETYHSKIYLVYNFDDKEGAQFLKENTWETEWNPLHDGVWVRSRTPGVHYIMIRQRGVDSDTLSLLAHECLHLTFAVLYDAGFKYSEDSEEAFTYFLQNILFQCLEVFKKKRK